MPRVKATPVKRGIDRFHVDERESLGESGENDTDSIGSEENESHEVQGDQQVVTGVRVPVHASFQRVDGEVPCGNQHWALLGKKSHSRSCQHSGPVHLHLHNHSVLHTLCSECEHQVTVEVDTVGLLVGRLLMRYISEGAIRLSVVNGSAPRIGPHFTLELQCHVHSSVTRLPAALVRWIATDMSTTDPGGFNTIDQQFSANAFLAHIAAKRSAVAEKYDRALFSTQLQEAGISTVLRDYQVQGVQWMHRTLSSSVPLSNWYLHGWVQVADAHHNVHCTSVSSNTSSRSSEACGITFTQVWYNLFTEALHTGSAPPTGSSSAVDTKRHNSVILADEMGVGKSLQIISLIALLKHQGRHNAIEQCSAHEGPHHEPAPQSPRCESSAGADPNADIVDGASASSSAELARPCLCGSAEDLRHREQALLGWVQCASCDTWLHAPCAGFLSAEAIAACDVFTCLACSCLQTFTAPLVTATALIVMPNTLINQWKGELLKHTTFVTFNNPVAEKGLKVFIYPDDVVTNHKGVTDLSRLDPRSLAQYDILFLSFRALQKGFHDAHVDFASPRIQRSRYAIFPPPFLCLQYRLLVVDETQNLETAGSSSGGGGGSQVLQMACRIPSVHRISVSGTPLGSGRLSDLHSLCQFLRLAPLHDRQAWQRLIERPPVDIAVDMRLNALLEVFSSVTLRRTKDMIQDQLGLPSHSVTTQPLQFSSFERALYEEKLIECRNALLSAQYSSSEGHLDLADAKARLEVLRKGCCHPQVLDGALALTTRQRSQQRKRQAGVDTAAAAKRGEVVGPRPLDEIMVVKVEQSRLQCEEQQRSLLFHLFALAGAVALQAQCGLLGMAVVNQEGVPSEDTATRYLAQAHCIYRLALQLLDAHRAGTVLVSMVKVYADGMVSVLRGAATALKVDTAGVPVPHAQDGISLRWDLSVDALGTLSVPSVEKFPTLVWSALPRNDTVPLPPRITTASSMMVDDRTEVAVPAELTARLTFSSGHRITGISTSTSPSTSISSWLASTTHQQGSGSDPVKCEQQYRYFLVLLPARVVLQVGVGSTDTYINVHIATVSSSSTEDSVGQHGNRHSGQRSKRWQVKVSSLQPYCCLVRSAVKDSGTHAGQRNAQYVWVSTREAARILADLHQDPAALTVDVQVSTTVQLQEAAVDADALQELHLCHNLSSLRGLLDTSAQQRSYEAQVRAFVQIIPPGADRQVGAALRGLQNVVMLEYTPTTTAVGVASGTAAEGMQGVVERAEAIEQEYLEAASGRKLSAQCQLTEALQRTDDRTHEIAEYLLVVVPSSQREDTAGPVQLTPAQRTWWNELLECLQEDARFHAALQGSIEQGEWAYRRLANVSSTRGLQYVLGQEFDETEKARKAAIQVLASLSKQPTVAEIMESTDCSVCRAYFDKKGPMCGHCKKQGALRDYAAHINCFRRQNKRVVASAPSALLSPSKKARGFGGIHSGTADAMDLDMEDDDFEVKNFDEGAVDGIFLMVLKLLRGHAGSYTVADADDATPSSAKRRTFKHLCALEIKRQEGLQAEVTAMMAAWDRYSDLLKAHDELAQSKTRVSLEAATAVTAPAPTTAAAAAGRKGKKASAPTKAASAPADLTSSAQLRPYEVRPAADKAFAAAVQADADLRKGLSSSSFYKEQVREAFLELQQLEQDTDGTAMDTGGTTLDVSGKDTYREPEATLIPPADDYAAAVLSPVRTPTTTCLICRERLFIPLATTPGKPRKSGPTEQMVLAEAVVVLPCAHRYHEDCVAGWVKKHKACPLCKAKAAVGDFMFVGQHSAVPCVPSTLVMQGAHVSSRPLLYCSGAEESKDGQEDMDSSPTINLPHREGIAVDARSSTSGTFPPVPQQQQPAVAAVFSRVRLVGKWGTKVDRLVQDLLLLVTDPERSEEKAIVFSQWTEMVDIVSEALRVNKVACVKCTNRGKDFAAGSSLERFRSDPEVRVLVMPLGLGAEGLDLIIASHVYLLEPLLNVHQELQAVNRIHRVGQRRATYVHRYVLQGTIEERISQVQEEGSGGTARAEQVDAATRGHASAQSPHKRTSAGKQRDDDLLSETDLRFILDLPAARVLGSGEEGEEAALLGECAGAALDVDS